MKPPTGRVRPEDHLLRRSLPESSVVEGALGIDAEKIVQVALNPDDELRNLQVALLYSLTSTRMDKRLVHGPTGHASTSRTSCNANWFTVAQWAVLTVGRNMRTRDLPHRAATLPGSVRRRLTPAVLSLRSADDRRVAAALSYGQVMVFVSVYRALLRTAFSDTAPLPAPNGARVVDGIDDEPDDPAAIERGRAQREVVLTLADQLGADVAGIDVDLPRSRFYLAVLDALAAPAGYQGEIARAFQLYERAAHWSEGQMAGVDRSPADLIFEANLRIAAIEQVILDGAVTLVVDHLPRHLTDQAEGRLATFAEQTLRVPRRIADLNASRRISEVAAVAKDIWARVMTDQVMVVAFPAETIRIGRDIPRRDWRHPFYAVDLVDLSPEAAALFDQFDRSVGDGRGAGAGDWRRFDDRMNFVANLLRSRQQDSSLFWQPFTDEDVARVWSGAYPVRIADPFEQAVRAPSFPVDLDGRDLDTVSTDELDGPDGEAPAVVEESME